MPVPERERDMDIYAAEQRGRRELLEEIADVDADRLLTAIANIPPFYRHREYILRTVSELLGRPPQD